MIEEDDLEFLMVEAGNSQEESISQSDMDVDSDIFNKIIEKNQEESEKERSDEKKKGMTGQPRLTDFLVDLNMQDFEDGNLPDLDQKSEEMKKSLDTIYEDGSNTNSDISSLRFSQNFPNDSDNSLPFSVNSNNLTDSDSYLPYSGDEEVLLNSLFGDKFDAEREQEILDEIDSFLKESQKGRDFIKEKIKKIDKVELEFQKFMYKRQREISLKNARRVIKEKVLPKLKEIDDKILERKEKHITHIKVLRKYSKFQKSDLENFKLENLELKKEILELKTVIKLLKVELRKKERVISDGNKGLSVRRGNFMGGEEVLQEEKNAELFGKSRKIENLHPLEKFNLKKKSKMSLASSISTKASFDSSDMIARLREQNSHLKQKITKNEEDFKIKMSRMKSFYDESLKLLNKKSPKKSEISAFCSICSKKNFDREAEDPQKKNQMVIAKERLKVKRLKENLSHKNSEIENLKTELLSVRNEIKRMGRGQLFKINKKLKSTLEKKNDLIVKLREENNFDYQLEKTHPKNKEFFNNILKYLKKFLDFQGQPLEQQLGYYREKGRSIGKCVLRLMFSPISELLIVISEFIDIYISGYFVNRTRLLENSLTKWKDGTVDTGFRVTDLLKEIHLLEKENEQLKKVADECELRVQNLKMKGLFNIDIFTDKQYFKNYIHSSKNIKELRDYDAAMPDEMKMKIQNTYLENYSLKMKNMELSEKVKKLRQDVKEYKFKLGIRIRKGKDRLKKVGRKIKNNKNKDN